MQQKANLALVVLEKRGKADVLDAAAHYAFSNEGRKSLVPVPSVYGSSQTKLQSARMKWIIVTYRNGN